MGRGPPGLLAKFNGEREIMDVTETEVERIIAANLAVELANPGSALSRALRCANSEAKKWMMQEIWKMGFCVGMIAQAHRVSAMLQERAHESRQR